MFDPLLAISGMAVATLEGFMHLLPFPQLGDKWYKSI